MQKLFSERIEEHLFEVYSSDRLEIPETLDSCFFSLALLVDGSRYSNEELFTFADECLRKGLCYLVAWGPDCERVHDLFDEVRDQPERGGYLPRFATGDNVVMTTWHALKPLADALFFFVHCTFPTDVFQPEWKHRIILSVRNEEWALDSVEYMKAVAASARPAN
jgi:hypothetical protein